MKIDDPKKKINHHRLFAITGIIAGMAIVSYMAGNILWGNILIIPLLLSLLNVFALKPMSIWFQHRFLPWLENKYEASLRWAMGRRTSKLLIGGMVVLLFFSIFFFFATEPNVVFFPSSDPKTVYITMELPLGTDIDKTDEVSREAEKIINKVLSPYMSIVKSVGVNVGNGKGGFFEPSRSPNKALIVITFVETIERGGINTSEIMIELSDALKGFVGAKFFVEKEDEGPPVGKPINIEVSGNDFAKLVNFAETVKQTIDEQQIPGIENLELDINMNKPEMQLFIDRDKVRRLGLSTQMVAGTLRTALYGSRVDKYKDGEDEYDIMLRLDDKYRYNVASLMNLKIKVEKDGVGYHIPVSSVADYTYGSTYENIKRKSNTRMITVFSNVLEGYNANKINEDIRSVLGNLETPPGYRWEMTGER
jgi:multidrug efflux pump subunit AcrB